MKFSMRVASAIALGGDPDDLIDESDNPSNGWGAPESRHPVSLRIARCDRCGNRRDDCECNAALWRRA